MEIVALLIGLGILAAIAFYVSRPLVHPRSALSAGSGNVISLEARRESLYTQIKELDLDHATGKVNDEDYGRIRADLVAQAAEVLRQIDGLTLSPATVPAPIAAPRRDDDVEAMIAARRKTRSASAAKTTDADVEAAIATRRKTTTLVCPQCGKPIKADDAFCAKCGAALRTQTAP